MVLEGGSTNVRAKPRASYVEEERFFPVPRMVRAGLIARRRHGCLRRMKRTASAMLLVLLGIGCGGATVEQLRARAAFDLQCPEASIKLVELDDRTQGVTGCGQRAT